MAAQSKDKKPCDHSGGFTNRETLTHRIAVCNLCAEEFETLKDDAPPSPEAQQATPAATMPPAPATPATTPAPTPAPAAVVTVEKKPIQVISETLEGMKDKFAAVLRATGVTPERFIRVTLLAIQMNPKLLEAHKPSLYTAVLRAAQLGLEPDGTLGQAYLIPFNRKYKQGNNWQERLEVQFIPGYKGLISLARRSGDVKSLGAVAVYEKDVFKVHRHLVPEFTHEPYLGDEDPGEVKFFYAMAHFKDGGHHWDFMRVSEVNKIRDNSSGYKAAKLYPKKKDGKEFIDSPWTTNYEEMGKKTIIRRIAKFLPMDVQKAALYDQLQEEGKKVEINDFGDLTFDESVIDGTAEEVDAETGEVITKQKAGASKLDSFAGKK